MLCRVIYMLMLLQCLHARVSTHLNQMTPTVNHPDELGEILCTWISPSLNTRQAGICDLWRLQSHFDGAWISKPLESKLAAHNRWPVSSQPLVLSTKPCISRLSRTMMVKPCHFSEASDLSLSVWILLMVSVQLIHSRAHTVFYSSSAVGWQFFDKSNLVLQWDKGDKNRGLLRFYSVL